MLLLADSQLLFRPDRLPQVAGFFAGRPLQAAYVGAANGHQPEFFQLACAALETLFGQNVPCVFVRDGADIPPQPVNLLILAGGRVDKGWEFLCRPDIRPWLDSLLGNPQALLVGVSAGAIHLARGCDPERQAPQARSYIDAFPHFVAVHEEGQGWPSRQVWQAGGESGAFVAIPLGGGLWCQDGKGVPVGNMSEPCKSC